MNLVQIRQSRIIYTLILTAIILVSLTVKLSQFNFDEFQSSDSIEYNSFAWAISHNLDHLVVLHNLGYPLFLAIIFSNISNINTTLIIQDLVSLFFSIATIPIFYLLARRFFNPWYSLLATCFIAFEPHIIQNVTFAISEPQYLFLFVTTLYLLTSKKDNAVILSFVTASLSMITRFEGVLLVPIILFVYIYTRRDKKKILRFIPFIVLFFIPLIAVSNFNITYGTHENPINAKIQHEVNELHNVSSNKHLILHTVYNAIKYLGWSMYPIFLIIGPIGLYFVIKKKPINPILVIGVIIWFSISGVEGYFRAYDTRYFMQIYPILALVGTYGLINIISNQKLVPYFRFFYKHKVPILIEIGVAIALVFSLYNDQINTDTSIHMNVSDTIVIYPTYTLSAYDRSGFYSFYKGMCDTSCLTIPDRFNSIDKIKSTEYGLNTFQYLGFKIVSDRTVDTNGTILKDYKNVIVLHNEYVTQNEFNAITTHPHVIYLYPNSLYAKVQRNQDNTITLINGHGYPKSTIANGFNWELDNSRYESQNCKTMKFYNVTNGWMLNCYPEQIINSDQNLWDKLSILLK